MDSSGLITARVNDANNDPGRKNAIGTTDIRGAGLTLCVGRYDGTNVKVFINAIEEASTSAGSSVTGSTRDAKMIGYGASESLDGKTYTAMLWDRSLSHNEIKQLYDIGPAGIFRRKDLLVPYSVQAAAAAVDATSGVIVLPQLTKPSYQSGYASNAAEAEYPGLWKGKVFHWAPCLGDTGTLARNLVGMDDANDAANAPSHTISKGVPCYTFDGTNEEIEFNTAETITPLAAIRPPSGPIRGTVTGVLWAKHTSTGTQDVCVQSGAVTDKVFRMEHVSAGWRCAHGNGGAWANAITGTPTIAANGEWQCVVYRHDDRSGDWVINVDGAISYSGNQSSPVLYAANFDSIMFGGYITGGYYWGGEIAEFALYNRRLSDDEVQLLYKLGPGGGLTRKSLLVTYSPASPAASTNLLNYLRGMNRGFINVYRGGY
jgi:hypothetical protein